LSYTTFDYSNIRVEGSIDSHSSEVTVQIDVTNTGSHQGREIVQVYISGPSTSSVERPAKSLEGFSKTRLLQPGEKETVAIRLSRRSFAYWSKQQEKWVVEKGVYGVQVGKSSRIVVASAEVVVEASQRWVGL
jgi:beta-glucosidase